MKTITKNILPTVLAALFITISADRVMAYDHDDRGWIDEHHQHHPFISHNGHRGYWDHDRHGNSIFITIG